MEVILDGWVFNILKKHRNYWIVEKEGKVYKVNRDNRKFERLDNWRGK